MALFTGSGKFTLGGGDARVYDIDFANDGGVAVDGSLKMSDCKVTGASVEVASGVNEVYITDCEIDPSGADSIRLLGDNDEVIISGNYLGSFADNGVYVTGSVHTEMVITDNIFESDDHGIHFDGAGVDGLTVSGNTIRPTTHGVFVDGGAVDGVVASNSIMAAGGNGIYVSGTSHNLIVSANLIGGPDQHGILIEGDGVTVQANQVVEAGSAATDTYDNIQIAGDRNMVLGNALVPNSTVTRYGINVASGSNNVVHANFLGDSSDYATADSVDNGTATLTAADDGVIGGQFAF